MQATGMQNFQETFETCKQSFISTFSVGMTVPYITQSSIWIALLMLYLKLHLKDIILYQWNHKQILPWFFHILFERSRLHS